jgi:hypothetical protein
MRTIVMLSALSIVVAAASGCTPPQPAAEPLKGTSTKDAFEGVQCSAVRPQSEPDLMGLVPGSRANLNRLSKNGFVAVRYTAKGCNVELELVSTCIGAGATYEFSPYSANERKVARNDNELFAALPIGAARLSGKLKGNRTLRTDYMLAGTVAVPPSTTAESIKLSGPGCARVTHVISAIYVGGFAMAAGEAREIEGTVTLFGAGGGARSAAGVENLADEGDADACKGAQREGRRDERCAVPLRVGLLALKVPEGALAQPTASADVRSETPPPAPPSGDGRNMTPVWIGGGAAIVGAGLGIAFTVMRGNASDDASTLSSKIRTSEQTRGVAAGTGCSSGNADFKSACSALEEKNASVDRNTTLMVVSFVGAGAAAAFAVGWYLLAPTSATTKKALLAPTIGGGAFGLSLHGAL